jgi:transposase
MDDLKRELVIEWLERIERSNFKIAAFFKNHKVPFSKAQYFIYKKRYSIGGTESLKDQRKEGGNRRLSQQAEGFLLGCVKSNPDVKLEWLQQALKEEFSCHVNKSTISRALKRVSGEHSPLPKGRRKSLSEQETVINPLGGFEIIVAIAYHLGWPQRVAECISEEINNLKSTKEFEMNAQQKDKKGRDKGGRFSKDYNQRKEIRVNRFSSISEKRLRKNWQSMDIVRDGTEVLLRKSVAILSLPVITMNGGVRSADVALGDSLKQLCGFNYKQSTLTKYLSELKYLGISTHLLLDLTKFWRQCWGDELIDSIGGPLLCYYIDGNTKAVWSSQRVKQNKVTMLGRVMGCLEQVFIHDGFGHPIYFETFSGHGPVGEHILDLFEKIEGSILDVPRSSTKVYRAIVMDSASNSVKTLRTFAAQEKYHYITPLDDNQWNERKVIRCGTLSRYRYGKATLRELEIELEDSNEKGYLISTRAVKIEWDNGKVTILLTSLPEKIVDASDVVRSYFRRWPAQELQFRHKKAAVALHRVVGYGKKETNNPRVLEKQQKSAKKIEEISKELTDPSQQINNHEKAIADLILKERPLRAQGTIIQGKRILTPTLQQELDKNSRQISSHKREIKKIEKEYGNKFRLLRKHQKEWLRLQGKEKVYEIDVELDQIVTFHRISLAHLFAYFIKHFLDEVSMSMIMILHKIIHLHATIEEGPETREIKLRKNDKDPQLMKKLFCALEKVNQLKIKGPRDKIMKFSLG